MRGSPLLRFFLLALALGATAFGLSRVTRPPALMKPQVVEAAKKEPTSGVRFDLVLSAPVESVRIDTGADQLHPVGPSPISGNLKLESRNPHVGLTIRWKNPPAEGEFRFAKLTLEIPERDTFVHVFDAPGNIDDLVELPLPATP